MALGTRDFKALGHIGIKRALGHSDTRTLYLFSRFLKFLFYISKLTVLEVKIIIEHISVRSNFFFVRVSYLFWKKIEKLKCSLLNLLLCNRSLYRQFMNIKLFSIKSFLKFQLRRNKKCKTKVKVRRDLITALLILIQFAII